MMADSNSPRHFLDLSALDTSTLNTMFPWRYSVNYGDLRSIGATVRVRF